MKLKSDFRIVLLTIAVLIAAYVVLPAAEKTPKFSADDHKLIEAYYTHLYGNLAPGSINRADFPVDVERALRPGEKLPAQLEKKLEALPRELEEQLSSPPAGFAIYKLGHHVLILGRSDREIADIIKDAGLTGNDY